MPTPINGAIAGAGRTVIIGAAAAIANRGNIILAESAALAVRKSRLFIFLSALKF